MTGPIVERPYPYVPGQPIEYDLLRLTDPHGITMIRVVLKKPGHAITIDWTAADCEVFERQLRSARTGIILPNGQTPQ